MGQFSIYRLKSVVGGIIIDIIYMKNKNKDPTVGNFEQFPCKNHVFKLSHKGELLKLTNFGELCTYN